MAASTQPAWRQGFDAVERHVAPRLDAVVRSEQFAVAVGLAVQLQRRLQDQASRTTRRVLHQLNLPAGTDVSRILNELGRLQLQVRELNEQLDETRAALAAAQAAPTPSRPRKEATRGNPARSGGPGRTRPARR